MAQMWSASYHSNVRKLWIRHLKNRFHYGLWKSEIGENSPQSLNNCSWCSSWNAEGLNPFATIPDIHPSQNFRHLKYCEWHHRKRENTIQFICNIWERQDHYGNQAAWTSVKLISNCWSTWSLISIRVCSDTPGCPMGSPLPRVCLRGDGKPTIFLELPWWHLNHWSHAGRTHEIPRNTSAGSWYLWCRTAGTSLFLDKVQAVKHVLTPKNVTELKSHDIYTTGNSFLTSQLTWVQNWCPLALGNCTEESLWLFQGVTYIYSFVSALWPWEAPHLISLWCISIIMV